MSEDGYRVVISERIINRDKPNDVAALVEMLPYPAKVIESAFATEDQNTCAIWYYAPNSTMHVIASIPEQIGSWQVENITLEQYSAVMGILGKHRDSFAIPTFLELIKTAVTDTLRGDDSIEAEKGF